MAVVDQNHLRRDAIRAVRQGGPVGNPAAAPLAVAAARRVQAQRTWGPSVVIPAITLAVLGVLIGGFALVWYCATVVPTLATEPWRARRRKDRALSAEAANLSLVDETDWE